MRPRDAVAKAMAAAERAIQLNPDAVDGYLARGLIRGTCGHDWHEAAQDFDRALQLNPDSPTGHYRRAIWYLVPVGRIEEAVVEIQRALELDPLSPLARSVEAWVLHLAGRGQAAVEHTRVAPELFPNSILGTWLSGCVTGRSGACSEAGETVLRRALQIDPENMGFGCAAFSPPAVYGRQSQLTGDWVRGLETGEGGFRRFWLSSKGIDPRGNMSRPRLCRIPYTTLGDLEKAYGWLEKASRSGKPGWLWLFESRFTPSRWPVRDTRLLLRKANLA